MKYSIFGFSQEYAIKLQKEQDGKVKKLDATDLLILRDVADFMNRSKIIKYTIDDKVYFSIQYATILEDLPILDIKKQALSDRLDKMVLLNVLEKIVVKNQSGTFIAFRMGAEYEKLLYSCTNIQTAPTSSELQVQMYSTTNHNTNITNNSSTKQEKEDESSSKKEPTWRDDFNTFLGLVNSAKEQLLSDKECKSTMEMYYPYLNYELSLQKMVDDYWGTEEGWQRKKKSTKRNANIDMVKTLKNGFSQHYNRLYKRTTTQSFSTYTPKKVSDRAMDYISTLTVPVQTERDGIKYLIDGTFVEDGKRYYTHSIKGKIEISMGAVARPSEDWVWNSNMLTWEQDERKTIISDMLF